MNENTKFFTGILLGAALGYVAGLLTSPESGDKIRKRIANEADSIANKLFEEGKEMIEKSKTNPQS